MTQFCTLDDTETAYDLQGEDGPLLLLMHGLQGGRKMLDGFVAQLAPHFRVVAYDQRDSGETRNPATPYDLARLAEDAALLVRALGFDKVHVMGTSFGGRVAQAFAILHPELVDKLVLGSTWPLPRSMPEINPAGLAKFSDIRSRLPASAGELAEMFVPVAYLDSHPELRRLLVGMPDASERAARRAEAAGTVVGDARHITASTLLIAGELDEMIPAAATESMLGLIADSQYLQLPGVGHTASLQCPDVLAAAMCTFLLARESV